MEHLVEIKPNTYIVNLPTFEESELAKRKKKQTEVTQVSTGPEVRTAPEVSTAPEAAAVPEAATASEVSAAPEVPIVPDLSTAPEPPAMPEVPAGPAVVDGTVAIKHTKISYDERTRLYTVECQGEFYDDSPDLDRIMRLVRGLVPEATDEELKALAEL